MVDQWYVVLRKAQNTKINIITEGRAISSMWY